MNDLDKKTLLADVVARIDPATRGTIADRPGAESGDGYAVPQSRVERERLREAVRSHVAALDVTAPVALAELLAIGADAAAAAGVEATYGKFATVLASNEIWRRPLARIPFNRRVLLLPQCLRSLDSCRGEMDEFGLLCAECGACPIGSLQARAEAMGYVVLIAEGTTIVTTLLEQGRVDGVIGVGCLSVLERAFGPMSDDAIPGIAVPLIKDGCEDTAVDVDWVLEALCLLEEEKPSARLDLERLKEHVNALFEPGRLREILDWGDSPAETVALEWLAKGGKRWRPFLSVAVARTLLADGRVDEGVERLAVAVECFHKASLVHDDIEDRDARRYDEPSLHEQYGVPIALNVGDLLIGEGYRLIARCAGDARRAAAMLQVAAEGHRNLCLGQGAELDWAATRRALSVQDVLRIFRWKTAPAFEVALRLGAVWAGAEAAVHEALVDFSAALGIAYQIRDDIEDSAVDPESAQRSLRPSLPAAISGQRSELASDAGDALRAARALLDKYRSEAIEALRPLRSFELKSLLQRALGRILGR